MAMENENTLRWADDEDDEPMLEAKGALGQVVTALGPIHASLLGSVLPNEHLIANFATMLQPAKDGGTGVQLESVWQLRRAPFSSLNNLSMEVTNNSPVATHAHQGTHAQSSG